MSHTMCIDVLLIPRKLLLMAGLWPTPKLTKIIILKLTINLIYDVAAFIIVTYNIIDALKTNNKTHLNWMACVLCPMVTYFAKVVAVLRNKTRFYSLLNDLKSETFNSHSEELNKHIKFIETVSKLLLRYLLATGSVLTAIAGVLPFITQAKFMIFPLPLDLGKYDTPYKFVNLFMTAYMVVSCIGFDVIYMSLLGLCAGQLNILEDRLRCLFLDVNDMKIDATVRVILRECTILHDKINEFVKKLSVLLSFPLFIQYVTGCFVICNAVLQLTILGGSDLTNVICTCCYSSIAFVQMFAYHWLGNEITFMSDKIIESCYMSKWYELDIVSEKSLILLMERAKRPLIVELYGLVFISLSSLGVIIRWSYSVFAIMKAGYS